jgi:hypothetical protein
MRPRGKGEVTLAVRCLTLALRLSALVLLYASRHDRRLPSQPRRKSRAAGKYDWCTDDEFDSTYRDGKGRRA